MKTMRAKYLFFLNALFFAFLSASAQSNESFFELRNTTKGVDVVFNRNDIIENKSVEFSIEGVDVIAGVTNITSVSPRLEPPFFYKNDRTKEFVFENGKTYTFSINGFSKSIKYRKPQKHILVQAVNDPGSYPKLQKAELNAAKFYKSVDDQLFLPEYDAAGISIGPSSVKFDKDGAIQLFTSLNKAVMEDDVFIFYFGGHGEFGLIDGTNHFYLLLENNTYLLDDDIIDFLKQLPTSSKKILILATCKSSHMIDPLDYSDIKNVSLFHSSMEDVPDGIFEELSQILDTSKNVLLSLNSFFDLALKKITQSGRYPRQEYDSNGDLFLYTPPRVDKISYRESWLPYNLNKINKISPEEKASFISEVVCLAGTIGCGTAAQLVWNKGQQLKELNLYADSYAKWGQALTIATCVSFTGLVASYFWHHSAVKKRILKSDLVDVNPVIDVYSLDGNYYASVGAKLYF